MKRFHVTTKFARAQRRGSGLGLAAALIVSLLTISATPVQAADGGTIRGHVSAQATGYNPDSILVTAYRDGDNGWGAEHFSLLDSRANFNFSDLLPGRYRIGFSDRSEITSDRYWRNATTFEAATDIEVRADGVVEAGQTVLQARPKLTSLTEPDLRGTATPGSTLTVTSGTWEPLPTSVTYQWHVDGVPIAGTNRTGFRLDLKDLGSLVQVAVHTEADGYAKSTSWSRPIIVVPAAPSNLFVRSGADSAAFSWNMSPGATSYQVAVYQGSKLLHESSNIDQTQSSFGYLQPYTDYKVAVRATFDGRYTSAPVTTTFRTKKLAAVGRVKVLERTTKKIHLNWPAVDGAARYQVTYGTRGKAAKTVKTNSRAVILRKLKPGTKYSIRVTSFAANGTKAISRKFSVSTRKK